MKIAESGLKNALEIIAKWFCGKRNLKINWNNGTNVSANLKDCVINVPIAACSGDFDKDALITLRSNVYHEAAHILLSEESKLKGTKFEILNGLEDVRIEAKSAGMGEGIRSAYLISNTKFMMEHGVKIAEIRASGKFYPEWQEALSLLMFEKMCNQIGWVACPKTKKLVDVARPVFNKVVKANSTGDCEKLAVKIYEIWKNEIKEEKKQQQQQQQNQKNQQQNKDQQQQGQGSGEQEQEQNKEQQKQQKQDKKDKQESGKQDKQDKQEQKKEEGKDNGESSKEDKKSDSQQHKKGQKGTGSEDDEPQEGSSESDSDGRDVNKSKETPEEDEKAEAEAEAELEKRPEEKIESDTQLAVKKEAERVMEDPGFYTSFRDNDIHQVFSSSNKTKNDFEDTKQKIGANLASMIHFAEEAFLSMQMSETQYGLTEGDIDMNMLPQIAKSLSDEIYCQKTVAEEINTAVSIVVDQSSSMGSVVPEVKKVLIAIGELLSRLDIPFEIFGTSTFTPPYTNQAFTRYRGIQYLHYKFFDEDWRFVNDKVMNIRGIDNNIDGEAIEYAEASLATRKETRKVIFSICDGEPYAGQYSNSAFPFQLKKAATRIREDGTEVYAIGINTDNPAKFYGEKNFIKINTQQDKDDTFSLSVIRTLVNTIINGRFQNV